MAEPARGDAHAVGEVAREGAQAAVADRGRDSGDAHRTGQKQALGLVDADRGQEPAGRYTGLSFENADEMEAAERGTPSHVSERQRITVPLPDTCDRAVYGALHAAPPH